MLLRIIVRAADLIKFDEAKYIVQEMKFTSKVEYNTWNKANPAERKKLGLPTSTDKAYDEWQDWDDYLGKCCNLRVRAADLVKFLKSNVSCRRLSSKVKWSIIHGARKIQDEIRSLVCHTN